MRHRILFPIALLILIAAVAFFPTVIRGTQADQQQAVIAMAPTPTIDTVGAWTHAQDAYTRPTMTAQGVPKDADRHIGFKGSTHQPTMAARFNIDLTAPGLAAGHRTGRAHLRL